MIELTGIELGSKLRLVGDVTAEVIELINDEWVRVRLLEPPRTEELCHATDIIDVT